MVEQKEKEEYVDWLNAKILQKFVIFDEAENVLLMKRSENSHARSGKWDLSGGSLSPEDLETSPQPHLAGGEREAQEEAGIKIFDVEPVWTDSGAKDTKTAGRVLVYCVGFKCKVEGIKPVVTLSHEHTEYKWVSKDEALVADFGDDNGMHKSIVKRA